MSQKLQTSEGSAKVPGYIVTFSDMVTLLLTFFVLLLSLAKVQDPELFNKGRHAFWRSLRCHGLGVLYGRTHMPDLGVEKVKYPIASPDKSFKGRSIDTRKEKVRRIFKKVSRSMTTMPSQIVAKTTKFSVTNVRFSPGDATLDESAKSSLTQFALDLQQNAGSRALKLYVLGLAGDETTEKKQWILSARRAQVVSDFLNDILPSELRWPVYSWGAGPGGDWVAQGGLTSKQSQILIAVLIAND